MRVLPHAVIAFVAMQAMMPQTGRAAAGVEGPAVARGIQFLKGRVAQERVGECALAGLAMVKAEVPLNDPAMTACLARIGTTFGGGTSYTPDRAAGPDIYEAACILLLLCNLDAEVYKPQIEAVSNFIQGRQLGNGSWDYGNRSAGDTSISQYAILGLWEAENAGVTVSPRIWDRAARWFLSVQDAQGAWNYHRDESQWLNTVSMTAAGAGSLLICQRQLARYRRGADSANPHLIPLVAEGALGRYTPETPAAAINASVARGVAWIGRYFTPSTDPVIGQSAYYGLYGIERLGALADRASLGGSQWFDRGLQFILSTQRGDGSWNAQHGEVPNTCWAILFMVKSTAKSVQRIQIKRLGAGTLVGGKGLPKDLTSMTIAGGRVLARPMNGAVEGMLAVLEDPRAQNADSALAGLVTRYQDEGPKMLRPLKDRFRRLLTDKDPGVRRVAAWGLGRTGDLDVAPSLIGALTDADDGVVAEARDGLRVLSRKLEGFGPPPNATPDQRKEAAKKWREWYEDARPAEITGTVDDEEEDALKPKKKGAAP